MKLKLLVVVTLIGGMNSLFAFDSGFLFSLKANFSGSYTDPKISKAELASLGGANKMEGMVGFIVGGEAELIYLFDSIRYFKLQNNAIFGGLGLTFHLGVGQGYAGQASGSLVGGTQVDVFFNAMYTPVISFGTGVKIYFLYNRLAVGAGIGGKIIADPTPMYDMYSNVPSTIAPEVGYLIITKEQMSRMNPLMFTMKASIEYNQPVLPTTELVLGAYIAYNIYKPGYITMPDKLITLGSIDVGKKLNTFKLNSLDFGLLIGLTFKV